MSADAITFERFEEANEDRFELPDNAGLCADAGCPFTGSLGLMPVLACAR